MKTEIKERENKTLIVTFRILQSICFGVFILGISLMLGDYTKYIELPISSISITTTMFGLGGAIVTGVLAKQCEKW